MIWDCNMSSFTLNTFVHNKSVAFSDVAVQYIEKYTLIS